jgi:hypothetical protein
MKQERSQEVKEGAKEEVQEEIEERIEKKGKERNSGKGSNIKPKQRQNIAIHQTSSFLAIPLAIKLQNDSIAALTSGNTRSGSIRKYP